MGRKKNQVIDTTPGGLNVADRHRVYGTLKTVMGFKVIEINSEMYMSPSLQFEATRSYKNRDGSGYSGWVVGNGRGIYSDPISNKLDALILLDQLEQEYLSKSKK